MNFAEQSNSPKLTRRAATRQVFLRLCAGVAAVTLAEGLAEPFLIEARTFDAVLPNLPPALEGLKVVQLTDPHRGNLTPDSVIEAAVRQAAAWKPDLVVLTGDYVRWDAADTLPFAKLLAMLSPRLGIIGVLGNHDYQNPDWVSSLLTEHAGVTMLRNANLELAPGLWVSGIEDTIKGMPNTDLALKDIPEGDALLFLTHNPVGVRYVTGRPCIALSGHTHGGQVRVPGLPPHYPPGMQGFAQIDGWGTYDKAQLYVSRGIGCTGYPIRLNCPPEVTLFTLRAA
ncbi:metallophosphoesterase [Armatimonas sp.]|uniref:metallophosphoesterase n=1 Tax=Armatimonas sp. TaxID=1872638 RepID=UPI00286C2705|nr:metallophosphoesterase [Armatimonas sp.]